MSRRTLFRHGTFWFEKQVHWRWHNQHARASSRQDFRGLRGKGFLTDARHTNGHQLCPSPNRHIPVLIRSGIDTVFALGLKETVSLWKETWHLSSTSHIDTSMTYCQSIIHVFRIILVRLSCGAWDKRHLCFILGSTPVDREGRSAAHLPLWKRNDFNFHITNFPVLSSNIPSSPSYGVFISHLIWYARACSSYECFILRAAQLSCKLLGQGNIRERLKSSLRKFYGRYGDVIKHYEIPFSKCYMTFWDMIIYSDTLYWSDISLNGDLVTELDLITVLTLLPY